FTAPNTWTTTAPAAGSAGTFTSTIASLSPSASGTFTIVVKVSPSAANNSTINNTASATTTSTENVTSNNSASQSITVQTRADLAVTKTGTPSTVIVGQNETYTITVTNNGPSDAQAVVVNDAVPANTTFVSMMQTSGPTFTISAPSAGGTGTILVTRGTFATAGTASFTLIVNVNTTAPNLTPITNTATISSSTTDTVTTNNTATATATAQVPLDFGDAPDSYGTLLASNGARHVISTSLRLGATVTAEPDGQPSATASA